MRLYRHFTELPAEARGAVVALGNFDGVHRGHQAVIGAALDIARSIGTPAGVLTFEPHPRALFGPTVEPFRLTPFRIKARLIEALGVDFVIAQHFDRDFASHTAAEFVDLVLVRSLEVRHVVVGYDYLFGRNRGGDAAFLMEAGAVRGFAVTTVDAVKAPDGDIYSSTRVRGHLVGGRPAAAAAVLGHDWEVEGRVETGDRRGRELGYPTANLHLGEYQPPATGVYAVRAGIDHGTATVWHDGVANFGRRPSFDDRPPLLEVHLFDFAGDLYHQHLRVALVEYLRPERRFEGRDALQAQMAEDCLRARAILAERHLWTHEAPSPPLRGKRFG
ncbi:MAG: bifunctional riboflavin kinase/FAD synthetase [Alphaproteobacteria bacterium]